MKNLATCKPTEFVRQTNRIRKAAEKWLKVTDIMNIRSNLPKLEEITNDMSEAERAEAIRENSRRRTAQIRKNLTAMLDAILEEHPDETLELLALICFVEPKDIDEHTMDEYIESITEMMSNQAVVGFFTSLERLGLMNTSAVSRA